MLKHKYIFLYVLSIALFTSCSTNKNTAVTRWYHSFNTRYNVYFNGETAYQEAFKNQTENYQENFSDMILMFPVSALPKEKTTTGGLFDRSIEKAVKAIKTHSIQVKPERNANKRNDPDYKEWMSRTEYNPFLHNAWMLLGKSQFHNGDFLQAASTFSYVSRIYNTQPQIGSDAKIWQAYCYSELDWFYEAEDILTKVKNSTLPDELQGWYETVYANLLIKERKYRDAIPYLQTAIQAEKNKYQKTREKYLLGQLYTSLGERDLAYNAFGEVAGSNAPYVLEFSAKIRQTEVYNGTDTTKIIRQLRNMAKSSKNKNYLDQLYYAMGNVYLSIPDTAKAIESYKLGVEQSVEQGINKALNQIKLGDIYFNQRKFIDAQPNYGEALSQLKKGDETYPRVSHRSEILDELVVHLEAVELQDSLLRLSRMSEEERLGVIQNMIAELKKKAEEEKRKSERDEYLAEQENNRAEMGVSRPLQLGTVLPSNTDNSFYFYNPQVVAQGKNAFLQKWGRRKPEDDWRRRNKSNPLFDPFAEETANADSLENTPEIIPEGEELQGDNTIQSDTAALSTDPYDPQYYLQQIPMTEEDIAASNLIISDGLYNAALIYKEKLEDIPLAIETFDLLNKRFPGHENKLMAYYHVYLIYLKEGNIAMSNSIKQKILSEFPTSELAIVMADPEYESNLKLLYTVPESLYEETYVAYMEGNINTIRKNYDLMVAKYNQSPLMPKFMFLNALSYVQTNDANVFKEQLKELISRYPDTDVSILAAEMMKGFQRGLILSSGDNMLARGGLFNIHFGNQTESDNMEDVAEITFSEEINNLYILMIVYPQGRINENMLLYTVANFNFGSFTVNDFDLEKTTMGQIGLLQIKGFNNYREILQYMQMIYAPEGYANELEQAVVIVPISVPNYNILMRGKSLDEYMDFFEEHFGKDNKSLIERWRLKQEVETEETFDETEEEILDYIEETLDEGEGEKEEENNNISNAESEETENDTIKDMIKIEPIVVLDSLITDSLVVPSLSELEQRQMEEKMKELNEQVEDVWNQSSETLDNVGNAVDEIMNDPIRGIQNIFKRKKSNPIDEYAKEQERLEKEREKQLKKEKEEEKALRELAKQKEEEEKELKKEGEKQKSALELQREAERQAKNALKQSIRDAKQETQLRRQKEREEAQKKKEEAQMQREKEREEIRKQRELEKIEAQKRREELKMQRELGKEEARKRRQQAKQDALKLRETKKRDTKKQ